MNPVAANVMLEQLKWRYATKKFDATKKIPPADWDVLSEALRLSPSSYGLQPWKFFVVNNPTTRQALSQHSFGQSQIVDASHLVVFTLKLNFGVQDANRLVQRISAVRGVPTDTLEQYRVMMSNSLSNKPQEQIDIWMTNQIYIALGQLLTAAAMIGVDACPMEGFLPAKYDEILGLTTKGYRSIVLATLGYRASDDTYASLPKVRYPSTDMIELV